MFVDTPEDCVIRAFLREELHMAVNNLRSDYNAKRQNRRVSAQTIRDDEVRARTVYALWSKVGGYDRDPSTDDWYHELMNDMHQGKLV